MRVDVSKVLVVLIIRRLYDMNTGLIEIRKYVDVSENPACGYCCGSSMKYGRTKVGHQRYKCRQCHRSFILSYSQCARNRNIDDQIAVLTCEGCGIRSISRILKISNTTVMSRIKSIALKIDRPLISTGKEYEVDEICTYCKSKESRIWIVYALRRDTKEVVDFAVGGRTLKTLRKVTETLVLSSACRIYTDRLPYYKSLINQGIHRTKVYGTNHIERKNLSIRTHLKRLQRKTICFTKNINMLESCLKIYFWRATFLKDSFH